MVASDLFVRHAKVLGGGSELSGIEHLLPGPDQGTVARGTEALPAGEVAEPLEVAAGDQSPHGRPALLVHPPRPGRWARSRTVCSSVVTSTRPRDSAPLRVQAFRIPAHEHHPCLPVEHLHRRALLGNGDNCHGEPARDRAQDPGRRQSHQDNCAGS